MRKLGRLSSGVMGLVVAMPGVALAVADPGLLPQKVEVIKDAKPEGWDPALTLGVSLALSTNSNFVGQANGNSVTGGVNLLGRLDYIRGVVDWRNVLQINEVVTRTPVIDDFVKSIDALLFESVIYYRISDIFGPFASFKLDTAIFEGRDVRPAPIDYYLDGVLIDEDVSSIRLTEGFQPLHLKEAIGFFLRPISTKSVEVEVRGGFGASQVFADGGRLLSDDPNTTDIIELTSLKDVIQAGAVIDLRTRGELEEGRINYAAHIEVMVPFINDDPQNRGAIELTNFDIGGKLGFKLFEWASLDYELKIQRLPQLVDAWQIQSNLLLTFGYTFID